MNAPAAPAPPAGRPIIAWSFSALEMFLNCPRKYWAVKVGKVCDDSNKWNQQGDDEHKSFDRYLKRTPHYQLPPTLLKYTPMLDRVLASPGQLYSEMSLCLDLSYTPCKGTDWNRAWVRGAADVLIVNGERAKVLDWKTGKPKNDPKQMQLVSLLVFQHFPDVQEVTTGYVFIHHNKVVPNPTSYNDKLDYTFRRDRKGEYWQSFLPDVKRMEQAKTKDEWPPTPNPLCAYCPYAACQYNTNPDLRGGP
jgi:CRISPR/Cas system-associated exonuclease Cas4 (RecB family)